MGPIVQELTPPVDPDRDHWRGGEHAPVTLVEYGDYECPYSRLAFGAIQRLGAELDERLRFAFRHLPLTAIHPHALVADHDRVVPADEVSEDLVGGARCPDCDQVLLRLVHGPDRAWLDLRGSTICTSHGGGGLTPASGHGGRDDRRRQVRGPDGLVQAVGDSMREMTEAP